MKNRCDAHHACGFGPSRWVTIYLRNKTTMCIKEVWMNSWKIDEEEYGFSSET